MVETGEVKEEAKARSKSVARGQWTGVESNPTDDELGPDHNRVHNQTRGHNHDGEPEQGHQHEGGPGQSQGHNQERRLAHDHDGRGHDHGHHHHHRVTSLSSRMLVSIAITLLVFGAELVGGFWTGSLALLSDAWHVLADAAALVLSYYALRQAQTPSDWLKTYGRHRVGVVAALINGVSLLVISALILYEAVGRFLHPVEVKSEEMFIIAIIGLLANLGIAFLLNRSVENNLNVRSAFLHVLGDALSSVAVILGGILMLVWGWFWVDPLLSVVIALMILRGAYDITRRTLNILLEGAPPDLDLTMVVTTLREQSGVRDVHDLHVWNISDEIISLTAHLIIGEEVEPTAFLQNLNSVLLKKFGINHVTLQLERECPLAGQLFCRVGVEEKATLAH